MPYHGPSGRIGEYPGDNLFGLPGEYYPTQIKYNIQLVFPQNFLRYHPNDKFPEDIDEQGW